MTVHPIIAGWVSIEGHRRLVQVIPDPVRQFWDKWELRGVVLLSLVSQILLTLLGNRRKYSYNVWIKSLVWSAYLMADWLPTFALGAISSKLGDYYDQEGQLLEDSQLMAFWASFFLIHLGGPDTITAYALEDNELWSRHLLTWLGQTLATLYIIILSWSRTAWLSFLSLPLLVIGFLKYGEKTWCLHYTTIKARLDSFLLPAPKPRYRLEDGRVTLSSPSSSNSADFHNKSSESNQTSIDTDNMLFMRLFVSLFMDVVFSREDSENSQKKFKEMGYEKAFKKVEEELGSAYDVFYTKAPVSRTTYYCISRFITLIATIIVLVLYFVFVGNKYHFQVVDHILTYLLLVGAVISEIYAIMLVTKHLKRNGRGMNSFGQYSFISLCIEKKNLHYSDSKSINKLLKELKTTRRPICSKLKQMIFNQFKSKRKMSLTLRDLKRKFVVPERLRKFEFHRIIITWHIVTQLCYYCDERENRNSTECGPSMRLSDYMFYLLVKRRYMLPIGTGLVTLRDTFVEAVEALALSNITPDSKVNEEDLCNKLRLCELEFPAGCNRPTEVENKSVFFLACKLAQMMLENYVSHEMWKTLAELWIGILGHAAGNSRVDHHAQQLRRGGEFLSHIWLLKAHLGALEQFHQSVANLGSECSDY